MSETQEYLKRVNAALALREIPDYPAALAQLQRASELEPKELSVHLLLGLTYQDLDQLEEAEKSYRLVLELDPSSKEAQRSLGLLLVRLWRYQEAIDLLKPLHTEDPKNVPVSFALASSYSERGKVHEAIEILQKTLELLPDNEEIALKLADILSDSGETEEAIKVLQRAAEINPSHNTFIGLGNLYFKQDDFAQAIPMYRKVIEVTEDKESAWIGLTRCYMQKDDLDLAFETVNKGLSLKPRGLGLLHIKADVLWLKGKTEECLQTYNDAIEIRRSSGNLDQLDLLLYWRDKKLLEVYGHRKALHQINRDLKENSDSTFLLSLKIDILLDRKDYVSVLNLLLGSKKFLYYEDIQADLACIYYAEMGLGFYKEAREWLYKVLDWQFVDKEDLLDRIESEGVDLYQKANIDVSRYIFEQVLEINPTQARSLYNLAFILIGEHEWEKAKELLDKAEQNGYQDPAVLLTNRGYIYICEKKCELAIKILDEAKIRTKDNDEAILHIAYALDHDVEINIQDDHPTRFISVELAIDANMATAYYLHEQVENAFALAQRAIDDNPEDCIGYRVLGCLHFSQGDYKLARKAWNKALRSTKSKGESEVIKAWLTRIPSQGEN